MDSKQELKRKKLFQYLRASLDQAGLDPDGAGMLICPLCWKRVDYERLTLEHIIPKALHGHRETLTCDACNAWAGKSLEPHWVGHHRFREGMKGSGSLPFELDIDGHRLAVRMSRDPNKASMEFHVVAKATSHQAVSGSQLILSQSTLPTIKASFSCGFNERRRQLALLKGAYLAAFQRFGYGLTARKGMQRIRELIVQPHSTGNPDLTGLMGEMPNLPSFVTDRQISFLIAHFSEREFLWVILKCRLTTVVYRFAILPIEEIGDEVFSLLGKHAKDNPHFEMKNVSADQFME